MDFKVFILLWVITLILMPFFESYIYFCSHKYLEKHKDKILKLSEEGHKKYGELCKIVMLFPFFCIVIFGELFSDYLIGLNLNWISQVFLTGLVFLFIMLITIPIMTKFVVLSHTKEEISQIIEKDSKDESN